MDYGLVLPSLGDDANLAGLAAAIDLAERHGFTDVWTTDHILVGHDAAEDYGRLYEADHDPRLARRRATASFGWGPA